MPAAPKSPRSKKSNSISKPKGAVRAKSGCYTCRIRRKKCDEKRMNNQEEGPCETCFRLKLECLGFGAKRPDWLRETSRVSEIRDRIKAHLAAQGMIKGHAGSGSRSAVQEDILRLSDYREGDMIYPSAGSSSSASSPRRGDSIESDQPYGHFTLTPATRNMFDHRHYDQHDRPEQYPVHSDIPSRSDSPCDTAMNSSVYDLDGREQSLYMPMTRYNDIETPARRSTFSKKGLYEYDPDLFDNLYTIDQEEPVPRTFGITYFHPSHHISFKLLNDSLKNYVDNVVKIQYLLGDRQVLPNMIWEAINNHDDSKEAVTLLSKAYYSRQQDPTIPVLGAYHFREPIVSLQHSLEHKTKETRFNSDDAMTALHVVSLFLFDGGGGDWLVFLNLAVAYVEHVLKNPTFYDNYAAALEAANPKDEFVVKTTIWFDVLASITTQEPPQLLQYIRELFKPDLSWIGNPPSYSMMSPMGCKNQVVWALAETSYLSYWKRVNQKQGTLSIAELVRKVADIDVYLEEGPLPVRPQKDEEDWTRYLASEIFRTATRLFLRTVESGDYPRVPEIRQAVERTFHAIRSFPKYLDGSHQSAIVRSTVFGIFICGALSEDAEVRHLLKIQLEQNQGGVNGVGNCGMTSGLLEKLWERWTPFDGQPVRWRDLLRDDRVLLV